MDSGVKKKVHCSLKGGSGEDEGGVGRGGGGVGRGGGGVYI